MKKNELNRSERVFVHEAIVQAINLLWEEFDSVCDDDLVSQYKSVIADLEKADELISGVN